MLADNVIEVPCTEDRYSMEARSGLAENVRLIVTRVLPLLSYFTGGTHLYPPCEFICASKSRTSEFFCKNTDL